MSFLIHLAGVAIQVEPYSAALQSVFSDYLSSGFPALNVKITGDLVAAESAIRRAYSEKQQAALVRSEASSEVYAACRAIAERLPEFGAFLLHGSAITFRGEGIVFVASSGTGKSTFSRAWAKRFPTEVGYVNDDKPFVRIEAGKAELFGSPWNGKHRLGSNCSAPLRAICLLERSETNWAKSVSAMDALPELLSHLYIPENPTGRSALFALIQALTHAASFYRVGCNLSPDAPIPCKEVVFGA